MYRTLPNFLKTLRFLPYAMMGIVLVAELISFLGLNQSLPRISYFISTLLILLVTLFFQGYGKHRPWRWIWRKWSGFNESLFPDINGVWRGHIASNWNLETANCSNLIQRPDTSGDSKRELQKYQIILEIRSTLWHTDIFAYFPHSKKVSETVDFSASKNRQGEVQIRYFFIQGGNAENITQTRAQLGAASLTLCMREQWHLTGPYWNNADYEEKLNAAGALWLTRVADHLPNGKNLSDYAE